MDKLRDEAWLGDAVLGLFAREWLLRNLPGSVSPVRRAQLFELFTSNQFLATFGEPTRVEAAIGRLYAEEGLAAAFSHLETVLLPRFRQTARNRKLL